MCDAAAGSMFTRASLRGHPIHPMLVVFPIGLYVTGFVALVAFLIADDAFWFRGSSCAMLLGAAIAVVAAVFGTIDLLAVARDTRAKRAGIVHGTMALATTTLFASAGLVMWTDWHQTLAPVRPLPYELAFVLATIGVVLVVVTGALGWRMTGHHHVGVSPIPGRDAGIELPEPLERWS